MALNASYGQIIGQIGMLFAVILIIRVLPEGISSVLVPSWHAERRELMFKLLDGPQTLGRGRTFWTCFLAVLAAALVYPVFADAYDVGNFAYFLIWIFMALGLCLMWGYGGMLCFGQTLFFGIAGYAYGVLTINMGGGSATLAALVLSIVHRDVRGAASSAIS